MAVTVAIYCRLLKGKCVIAVYNQRYNVVKLTNLPAGVHVCKSRYTVYEVTWHKNVPDLVLYSIL